MSSCFHQHNPSISQQNTNVISFRLKPIHKPKDTIALLQHNKKTFKARDTPSSNNILINIMIKLGHRHTFYQHYQHHCHQYHHHHYKKKLGDGLACYQCRSDEIAECGDPFISSRSNNYFTNMISFVFRFL